MAQEDKELLLKDLLKNPYGRCIQYPSIKDGINAHHFDYRGLIPMGLANDATGLNVY